MKKTHKRFTEPAEEGVEADLKRYVAALEDKRRDLAAELPGSSRGPLEPSREYSTQMGESLTLRSRVATPGPSSSSARGSAPQTTSAGGSQPRIKIRAWKIHMHRFIHYEVELMRQGTGPL